jgi:predicted amino acid-binding ACT domain protein
MSVFKNAKIAHKGMRREGHVARIGEMHADVQCLIQRIPQSIISNNLSFMMSLLYYSASTRP